MLIDGWRAALILGGIRSGKSEFAESLLPAAGSVRYVATAAAAGTDPEWAARIETHRVRRPAGWITEEIGADPARLPALLAEAKPDETLLVDDLGGWVAGLLEPVESVTSDGLQSALGELADAIRDCPGRVLLVSPEVGLSVVPPTPLGRAFADALGTANQAVAGACEAVVLVVAGQPTWLKGSTATAGAGQTGAAVTGPGQIGAAATGTPEPDLPEVITPTEPVPARSARTGRDALTAPTMTLPMIATGLVIQPGMELPMPDEDSAAGVAGHLAGLDVPGAGFGALQRVIEFAAGTQGRTDPRPWRSIRMLLIHGDHEGGAAAGRGPEESARLANQARAGDGPLAALAARAGASLQVVDAATTAAMEEQPAQDPAAIEAALRHGWRLAEQAVDSGVDLIVLGSCGAGTDAAAAAVLSVTSGAEPAAVLGRVVLPGGVVDDNAWMLRCAAVRDAVHRMRHSPRAARDVLAEVGGADIAIATGVLLGATARRTPVLLDGPVGVAAAMVSRDLAGQARHWCLLPDTGGHPAVRLAADVLDLTPLVDLRMDLGEGATSLAVLPLLQAALATASTLPRRAGPAPAAPLLADPAPAEPDRDGFGFEPWEPEPYDPTAYDSEPSLAEPAATEPIPAEPTTAEPAAAEPAAAQPAAAEPAAVEPALPPGDPALVSAVEELKAWVAPPPTTDDAPPPAAPEAPAVRTADPPETPHETPPAADRPDADGKTPTWRPAPPDRA